MLSATNRPAEFRRKGTGPALCGSNALVDKPPAKPMAEEKQIEELITFLKWKEPEKPNAERRARLLLEMHPLEDVGVMMRDKYKLLPAGWRNFVPFTSTVTVVEPSVSDLKVDEIIDSEQRFLQVITEVLDTYVAEIFNVFKTGDANAIDALGITHSQAMFVFGGLQLVREFSEQLLEELECIGLIRTKPARGEGRAIHVGNAFLRMAPKLQTLFGPAVIAYTRSIEILAEATDALRSRRPSTQFPGQISFILLWESVTADSQFLKQKQLSSVLITPMQRLTRYELLLSVLVKDCDHDASVSVVELAHKVVGEAVHEINEAMRQAMENGGGGRGSAGSLSFRSPSQG